MFTILTLKKLIEEFNIGDDARLYIRYDIESDDHIELSYEDDEKQEYVYLTFYEEWSYKKAAHITKMRYLRYDVDGKKEEICRYLED